jgi:catabolite regulation protein CreA
VRAIVHSLVLITFAISAAAQAPIDVISTTFRWLGPNGKIAVEWHDDPKVVNVSVMCRHRWNKGWPWLC